MASRKSVSDAFKAIDGKKVQIELWGLPQGIFLESFSAIVEDSGDNRVKLLFPDNVEIYIMYGDIQTSFRSNIDDCDMQFRYNLGIVDYKGATVKISTV